MLGWVQVFRHPWHREVHGAELLHQALKILLSHLKLNRPYVHKGKGFRKIALWEGDCSHICVNIPPQDFLDTGPVALLSQEFLAIAKFLDSSVSDGKIHLRS